MMSEVLNHTPCHFLRDRIHFCTLFFKYRSHKKNHKSLQKKGLKKDQVPSIATRWSRRSEIKQPGNSSFTRTAFMST